MAPFGGVLPRCGRALHVAIGPWRKRRRDGTMMAEIATQPGSFVCIRDGSGLGLVTGGKQTFRPERRLGSDMPRYQPQRQTASPGSPGHIASGGSG